jgi:hypothetical protein
MTTENIRLQKPAENHIKAAEHLELAAKHHREAAKHHKEGNPKEAACQAYIAHGNLLHAIEYQEATTMTHSDTHSAVAK